LGRENELLSIQQFQTLFVEIRSDEGFLFAINLLLRVAQKAKQ
jgi:hypothetical protein